MKKTIIYNTETGKPVSMQSYTGEQLDYPDKSCSQLDVETDANIDDIFIESGKINFKPRRPSEYHIFDYSKKQWIDLRTPEIQWSMVRIQRDRKLLSSDWTQLPDVPLQTKELWASYRQALRDITQQPDPFNIIWPQPPSN